MGRLAIPPEFKKSKQIIAKVTAREHEKIVKRAYRRRMSISSYLRQCAGLKP